MNTFLNLQQEFGFAAHLGATRNYEMHRAKTRHLNLERIKRLHWKISQRGKNEQFRAICATDRPEYSKHKSVNTNRSTLHLLLI